ncbi:MAG: DUF4194 domain-containing protein [Spirochaetales bacterium]|nr:DUF4194 domain-containing protein [Spirochaetales bacterium]
MIMDGKKDIDVDLAALVIKLLRGPVYEEDSDWSLLLVMRNKVTDYLGLIGLEIDLQEAEGFCYLRQMEAQEDSPESRIPRLVTRRRITFEATLLCVILREELERFDTSSSESTRLFIRKKEIRERIRIYFKEKTDETSLFRELDKYIHQVESLGFLKQINLTGSQDNEDVYEVRRIIKAKVDPEFLNDFKKRLEIYVNAL